MVIAILLQVSVFFTGDLQKKMLNMQELTLSIMLLEAILGPFGDSELTPCELDSLVGFFGPLKLNISSSKKEEVSKDVSSFGGAALEEEVPLRG